MSQQCQVYRQGMLTTSVRMDNTRGHMVEKILNLTLDIIHLLTGETFPVVKSGDLVTFTVPSHDSMMKGENSEQKILEAINEIVDLLAGESEDPSNLEIIVKEEMKGEKEYDLMQDSTYPQGPKDLCEDTMIEPTRYRNPRKGRVSLLDSWDSTKEGHSTPHHNQSDNTTDVNIVKKEKEETSVRGDQHSTEEVVMLVTIKEEEETGMWSTEEVGMIAKVKEEEDSTDKDEVHGHNIKKTLEQCSSSCPGWQPEVGDTAKGSLGENIPPGSVNGFQDPPNQICALWSLDDAELICSVCGRSMPSKEALHKHQVIHSRDRPFPCSKCDKRFFRKETLNRHQFTHSVEKPFSCSECGKCFSQKSYLRRHNKTHTGYGGVKFSCSECGKCFPLQSTLRKHWKRHIGDLPFSCSDCGKRFGVKGNLDIHRRVHTGERPYSCSECGKSFARKPDLRNHIRIHTAERPFSCSECGKSFTQRPHLRAHLRVHMGIRPYQCSECGKTFIQNVDLVKHQKFHIIDGDSVAPINPN